MGAGKRGRPPNDACKIIKVQNGPAPGVCTVHIKIDDLTTVAVIRRRTRQRQPETWVEKKFREKYHKRAFLGPHEQFRKIAKVIWTKNPHRYGKDIDAIVYRLGHAWQKALKQKRDS